VLDEADQMLDMGFEEDMEVILQQVRGKIALLITCNAT
jgi:superfamily II DNA/RNA helicase